MLPWQEYRRCHYVSFVMYISGAKLKNTAGDILDGVLYCFN